jgi:hypothetical protein
MDHLVSDRGISDARRCRLAKTKTAKHFWPVHFDCLMAVPLT